MIRVHSHAAAAQVKLEAGSNDLLARLKSAPEFAGIDLDKSLDPALYVGRAPEQVDEFWAEVILPIRDQYADEFPQDAELKV
ncbi:MAG: hypothetical protein U0892_19705 [Pirellulales bacterium]